MTVMDAPDAQRTGYGALHEARARQPHPLSA